MVESCGETSTRRWTLDRTYTDDPRTPSRWHAERPGPWRDTSAPAHGIYTRPAEDGLTDWAAAIDGWIIWRWTGPRMKWRSELVSPWNPILAQRLTLEEFGCQAPDYVDADRWTAGALLADLKAGGYFVYRSLKDVAHWKEQARAAGLTTRISARDGWVLAARRGSLSDHYDLTELRAEYRRILPAESGRQVASDLAEHASLDLMHIISHHEDYPMVVCGLAFGYPPEVTAGLHLADEHRCQHDRPYAEQGAYCPHCHPIVPVPQT